MEWFKKHKVLSIIGGVFLFFVIVSALSGGAETKNSSSNDEKKEAVAAKAEEKKEAKPAAAAVGTPVSDGKFEFVVSSFKCGVPTVGENEYLTKTAQGQYCLLSVSVKNIGDKAQSLFSANQLLLDAANKEYSADDTATMYAAPSGSTWYSDINPGNSVNGTIVFDVPKDVTPTVAELHDSAFSNGAKVNLQ